MNGSSLTPSIADALRRRLSILLDNRFPLLDAGELVIRLPGGRQIRRRGDGPGPRAALHIHSWRAVVRALVDGEHGFADGYLAREWSSPDLLALLALAMIHERPLAHPGQSSWMTLLVNRLSHGARRNSRQGSRRNIAAHYNLGNDFYRAWLDEGMSYSSALYQPGDSLERAQERKLDRILDLLELEGPERVLEIGCGWGALAARLARRGCAVTGITLSTEQLAFARLQVAGLAAAATPEIELKDYRDITGRYDRIASIEMLEAVGEPYWPRYFNKLRDSLDHKGVAVLQAITIEEARFAHYRRHPDFIQRYIFPGGMLPTKARIEKAAGEAGLALVHREDFGMSYAQTLAEWRRRFVAAWPAIEAMGFDKRFKRMWEYYLAYCETGFRAGFVDVSLFKFRG